MVGSASDLVFDWDDTSHLARHRIDRAEVERLLSNDPAIKGYDLVGDEARWTAVGVTRSLRVLVVIFTVRDEKLRAITGWDADKRTKKEYFTQRGT